MPEHAGSRAKKLKRKALVLAEGCSDKLFEHELAERNLWDIRVRRECAVSLRIIPVVPFFGQP